MSTKNKMGCEWSAEKVAVVLGMRKDRTPEGRALRARIIEANLRIAKIEEMIAEELAK